MSIGSELLSHLASGVTTLCHAWALERADGYVLGFTDHDRDLAFDGMTFRADSGLTALALQQGTGLSVDNTEALGALSDKAISEADIEAGKYDNAAVRCWLVNWADVNQRSIEFQGYVGEIRRNGGAFEAEMLGLSDCLNRPVGRVYQSPCSAVLGDQACGRDVSGEGYQCEVIVEEVNEHVFRFEALPAFDAQWFKQGVLEVLDGRAFGQRGSIKKDDNVGDGREITLWSQLRIPVQPGDRVRLTAGCDKRMETCKNKFNNLLNYQGFPDIPGNDWMIAHPASGMPNGGSRR